VRRAAKIDVNHGEIVSALRGCGVFVRSTAGVGDGFPDIIFAFHGGTYLAEIKTPKGTFTEQQLIFYAQWPGTVFILRSVEDVERLVGGYPRTIERWENGSHFRRLP